MKRRALAIVLVSLMMLALFVITVNAETRDAETCSTILKEKLTLNDGFGTIMGYIKRGIGIFGVNDADVTGKSAFFGTYSTKTNWQGYYVLDGLELSKNGFAYYDVTVTKNGYEVTKEGVYVTGAIVWLNFTLPSGGDSYSEEESLAIENSPAEFNDPDSSANNPESDESTESNSPLLQLIQRTTRSSAPEPDNPSPISAILKRLFTTPRTTTTTGSSLINILLGKLLSLR